MLVNAPVEYPGPDEDEASYEAHISKTRNYFLKPEPTR